MNNWWKNPVLQGPENDYGDYDYLIEELPSDHAGWSLQRYTSRCDSCGKESHLLFRTTHYFYCYDGWDSVDHTECWKCMLKSKVWSIKHKFKNKIEVIKMTLELYKDEPKWNMKKCYNLAAKIVR